MPPNRIRGIPGASRTVTLLIPNIDDELREAMTHMLLKAMQEGVVVVERPLRVRDDLELLSLAESMSWDVLILLLNNIVYTDGERSAAGITNSALRFLHTFKKRFSKPVIAFYGHQSTVLSHEYVKAGALVCLQLAGCKIADFVDAIHLAARNTGQG
jgi:hypothetical protein